MTDQINDIRAISYTLMCLSDDKDNTKGMQNVLFMFGNQLELIAEKLEKENLPIKN